MSFSVTATCNNTAAPLYLPWTNVTVSQDGHATSRGIAVGIGTPQQIVALIPSISDDVTWLYNAQDCVSPTNDSCLGYRGGVYNQLQSSTYRQTTQGQWNGTHRANELDAPYIYFNDNLYFGSNGTAYGFPLLLNQPGHAYQSGLGIGPDSPFLDAAVKGDSAPSRMYGLWTGSQSEYHPADGALWIGGYDTARVDGPFTTFPSANGDDCYSCAQITNLTYINTNHSTSLLTSSLGLNVGLEPYVGTLEMPADIYANFVNATGGISFNNRTWLSSSADLGNLSVTFSNGYQTVIPWWELFLNPQDYDDDGTLEIQNSSLVVSTVSNYTDPDGYFGFWGLPILAGNYMIMDYDSQSFSLAKARQGQYTSSNGYLVTPLCKGIAPITTTPPVPGPTPPPTSNSTSAPVAKQSHTNVGAIAGGVVGGVIGVAIIVILAFFLFRSRRREKQYQQEQGSVTGSTTLAPGSQADRTSKIPPSSPTEISEADHGNINQWLHTQDHKYPVVRLPASLESPNMHSELGYNPVGEHENRFGTDTNYQEQAASPTLNQPFEMPAHYPEHSRQ